jgi:mono/diheme cytochrome c family protein
MKTRRKRRFLLRLVVVLAVLAGALGVAAWYYLFRTVTTRYDDTVENFKYGSIGTEPIEGIPYWLWVVLPRIFPDKLPGPGGYASLGLVWEEGKELPVGFSKKTVGFDRVGINCAVCHTATWRASPSDPKPNLVFAAPGHQFWPQGYLRFLQACASDPRFNADRIMREIGSVYELGPVERALYRYVLIPQTKQALLEQKKLFAPFETRTDWGRGRVDPFNPVKFSILKQPVDETIGNSDIMPIWNMKARRGMRLHWDGLSGDFHEVAFSSAIGDGVRRNSVERENTVRMLDWLDELPPPKFPFPVDSQLAARGGEIYARDCAACHAPGGQRTGTVVPLAEVGTDRHRLDMWTPGASEAYTNYDGGYWEFKTFKKTDGYASVLLDGVWLRAPYLHNGSVPTLADLLEPPERRTPVFWRGYDVYDPVRVGFVSTGPEAEARGTLFDTSRPANSNAGHLWGTALAPEEKRALIEYLKTL